MYSQNHSVNQEILIIKIFTLIKWYENLPNNFFINQINKTALSDFHFQQYEKIFQEKAYTL